MRRIVCFILILVLAAMAYAKVYKWTDSRGVVHFSDQPHRGAVEVSLPKVQNPAPPPPSDPIEETPSAASEEKEVSYAELKILQPVEGETLRNNQGLINISAKLVPELREGDQFQLIFDGRPVGPPQASPNFTINNVNRGSHSIAIQVVDGEGNAVITSDVVTVFLHRPRVGMVPETRPKKPVQ